MTIKPMLAESIDASRLQIFCKNPKYVAQQKLDGTRLMIHLNDGNLAALNRNGEPKSAALPRSVQDAFERMDKGQWVFDGELVDNVFWLFDLPSAGEHVKPSDPYSYRRAVLAQFYEAWAPGDAVRLLPVAVTTTEKLTLAKRLLENAAEGLMFKDDAARYLPGKRTRGILKAKFVKTVDCVVTDLGRGRNNKGEIKANMVLSLYRDGQLIEVGECTTLAGDGDRIRVGDVVEVRYLYACDPKAPRLYQPTYPKIRDDKPAEQCLMDQVCFTDKSVLASW